MDKWKQKALDANAQNLFKQAFEAGTEMRVGVATEDIKKGQIATWDPAKGHLSVWREKDDTTSLG